ncbi:hypothetical protein ACIRU3_44370 [Streptomyces sp. NPDC101151]|uniref:hypothetical protein n=1 Tax=Streptomyces sp. NPDC101151 TaxID=3366115 RepID=UPI0037F78E6A
MAVDIGSQAAPGLARTLTFTLSISPICRAMSDPSALPHIGGDALVVLAEAWRLRVRRARCGMSITARPPTCPGAGEAEARSSAKVSAGQRRARETFAWESRLVAINAAADVRSAIS